MNVPTYLFALYDFWPFFNRPPYDGFQIWIKLSPLLGFEPWTYPIANRRANLWAMTTWFKSKVKFPPSIFSENFSSWHIFHILMRSFTPDLLPVKVFIVLVNFYWENQTYCFFLHLIYFHTGFLVLITGQSNFKSLIIVIRYNSVWRANQELVGIHNNAAHEELVEIYNQQTSRKS